uniref:Uncharacterized protein n=1 Tax=Clastoptera arizonana TaxID=38151 RepID=A0A1B6E2C9_9HEMI
MQGAQLVSRSKNGQLDPLYLQNLLNPKSSQSEDNEDKVNSQEGTESESESGSENNLEESPENEDVTGDSNQGLSEGEYSEDVKSVVVDPSELDQRNVPVGQSGVFDSFNKRQGSFKHGRPLLENIKNARHQKQNLVQDKKQKVDKLAKNSNNNLGERLYYDEFKPLYDVSNYFSTINVTYLV